MATTEELKTEAAKPEAQAVVVPKADDEAKPKADAKAAKPSTGKKSGAGKKRRKKKTGPLNKVFHYAERGGTFGDEIAAGFTMALLGVCGAFMNMQLILLNSGLVSVYAESGGTQIATNGEVYAWCYFVSMIAACVGSLLIGVIARLPFVQVSSLGLSAVLISLAGTASGLTYYNIVFLSLIGAVAFAVVAGVPVIRNFVKSATPEPVKKALPAAAGLLLIFVAVQLTGAFTSSAASVPSYGAATYLGTTSTASLGLQKLSAFSYTTDRFHPQLLINVIAVIVAVGAFVTLRKRSRHPFLAALLIGTLVFLTATVLFVGYNMSTGKFSLDFIWGRAWIAGSEDAMQTHIKSVMAALSFGKFLSKGADFSEFAANGGNQVLICASVALNCALFGLFDTDATLETAATSNEQLAADIQKGSGLVYLASAAGAVVATVLGIPATAVGKESVAGVRDGGRSGLAAIVAAIIFLVSAFVMIIPALFGTVFSYTLQMNMYGHYGTVMQLLCETGFSVADIVMAIVGAEMALAAIPETTPSVEDAMVAGVTIFGTFVTSNIALGVATGVVAYVLANLVPAKRRKKDPKPAPLMERIGGAPTLAWAVVCVLVIVLAVAA